MALTKDQILAADDMGLLKVEVPEWGGEVYIRVFMVGERDSYERMVQLSRLSAGGGVLPVNGRSELLWRVLCDEKGSLMFSVDDVEVLSKKSGAVMGRLFDMAMKHNYLREEDVQQLGKS
jgi:hypothetical protein